MPTNFLQRCDYVYQQSTGYFYLADREDVRSLIARGYSGKGEWRDKPSAQDKAGKGPIPRGVWRILAPVDHPRYGKLAFALQPFGHNALHRSEFFIHGDNRRADFSASSGCIILDRRTREFISGSGIRALIVVE